MKRSFILRLQKRHSEPPAFFVFDGTLALATCEDSDVRASRLLVKSVTLGRKLATQCAAPKTCI
jgi:hypothetical protein